MISFKKFLTAMSFCLIIILPVTADSILFPSETGSELGTVNYSPFFGYDYDLYTNHYNSLEDIFDIDWSDVDGIGSDTDIGLSFYFFGTENNSISLYESDGTLFNMEENVIDPFFDTVLANLWDTSYQELITVSSYSDTDYWDMVSTVFQSYSSNYIGIWFFPQNAVYYLIDNDYLSSEFTISDTIGMTNAEYIDYLTDINEYGETEFSDWYSSTSFADDYGLVTDNLASEAAAVQDYAFSVLTSPVAFSLDDMVEASSDIIYIPDFTSSGDEGSLYFYSLTGIYYFPDFDASTGMTINLSEATEYYGSLWEDGVVDNIYEAELFNIWFLLEYVTSGMDPLFSYSLSGQSALSLTQIVIDTQVPLEIAGSTILSEKPQNESSGESSSEDSSEMEVVIRGSNNPVADTSFTLFSVYDNAGSIFKTSGGYDFIFPGRQFEVGVDINGYLTYFSGDNSYYETLDATVKGQFNFFESYIAESHAFVSLGATLNEAALYANYINTSVGIYEELYLGPLYLSVGEILYSQYWSQFPQYEIKSISAARVGVNILNMLAINADVIYSRALGVFYESEWYSYEGDNLNYLKAGVSLDLYAGDAFSLTAGVRRDFLMENYSSMEFYLGGGYVF